MIQTLLLGTELLLLCYCMFSLGYSMASKEIEAKYARALETQNKITYHLQKQIWDLLDADANCSDDCGDDQYDSWNADAEKLKKDSSK